MTKFFLTSKTILGGALAALPGVLSAMGITIPELDQFSNGLLGVLDSLNEIVGLGLVIWGRLTAEKPLTLLPKGP